MDAKSIIRVLANKNFTHTVTDLDHLQNIYVLDGKETELEMSRAYNTEFLCEYSMAWYPFDSQTCHLDFVLDASAAAFVKLVNGTLEYWGPVELAQYFVRNTLMQEYVYRGRTGVRVLVVLGRRLLSNILTVYVPTVDIINHNLIRSSDVLVLYVIKLKLMTIDFVMTHNDNREYNSVL